MNLAAMTSRAIRSAFVLALFSLPTAVSAGWWFDEELSSVPAMYRGVWIDSFRESSVVRLVVSERTIILVYETGKSERCDALNIRSGSGDAVFLTCDPTGAEARVRQITALFGSRIAIEDVEWEISLNGDQWAFTAQEKLEPPIEGWHGLGGEWVRKVR